MRNIIERFKALPLIGPAIIVLIMFCLIPLGYLIVYSFSQYDPFMLVDFTFTLENYKSVITDGFYKDALFRTFRVAFLTAIITLIIGYPLAYYLRISSGVEKTILIMLLVTPTLVSNVIIG